jgi:ribose 5-phosphate isomerase A
MDQDELKRMTAAAALEYVAPGSVIGVGSGTTVAVFIELLGAMPEGVRAGVSSSEASSDAMRALGIEVVSLERARPLDVYVDGADEVDPQLRLIKGRGGAHTREKVIAAAADRFICIVDESKMVDRLGSKMPVPVEVVPMAEAYVLEQIEALGGSPKRREGYLTDNGNLILDVTGLDLSDPVSMEVGLNAIPGVLDNGLFVRRKADVVLCAAASGVRTVLAGA